MDYGVHRKREVFSVIRFHKISRPKGEGDRAEAYRGEDAVEMGEF